MGKTQDQDQDQIAGYNIFDDLLNDVVTTWPALGIAIENLIPTIKKHLGDFMDKLAITDTMEIAQNIKNIFDELKATIASGEVKAIDFLKHLKAVIDAKVPEATPIVKAALAKIQAAVDEMIAKDQDQDQIAGYNIFDDLLNDVVTTWPALGIAIENLIPTIKKHLGDFTDKLAITDIMEIAQNIKNIFDELKATIASGEVKAIDFLKHLKA